MLRGDCAQGRGDVRVRARCRRSIKTASARFPVGEVVLFRSLFALAVLVVWLALARRVPARARIRAASSAISGARSPASGGMFANFIALSLLPLADATAFTFATPLMVVPLAALTLGETVRPLSLGGGGARLRRRARHAVRPSRRGPAIRGGGALARGRHDRARRRRLLGGGDDPDPAADAIRADRRDRLLFLLADGRDQRGAARGRRALAGGGARRRLHGGPAIRRARRAANSSCSARSACSAAPGRS